MFSLPAFEIARLPRVVFGHGGFNQLPSLAATLGKRLLIVTGGQSLRASHRWQRLCDGLRAAGLSWESLAVTHEPSPSLVDQAVTEFRPRGIEVVLGIGGGSVLDAAKAIAGLLPHGPSVIDHLEGVGRNIPYRGPATPWIAVPTTAGTGSEATRNAVLSVAGADGFKKSFRHDALVARIAVVDPLLLATCTPELIAANGMDAFTQLLESFVSTRANPFSDALAQSGMQAVKDGFFAAWRGGDSPEAEHGRTCMAYASLLSGITLAQAGLGSVHGLAAPLGAGYPIPHGVVCGSLVAAATEMNIQALRVRAPDSPALAKYATVAELLAGTRSRGQDEVREDLVRTLYEWTERLRLPALGAYGVTEAGIDKIVAGARGSSMQTNPIVLTDPEIAAVVRRRL